MNNTYIPGVHGFLKDRDNEGTWRMSNLARSHRQYADLSGWCTARCRCRQPPPLEAASSQLQFVSLAGILWGFRTRDLEWTCETATRLMTINIHLRIIAWLETVVATCPSRIAQWERCCVAQIEWHTEKMTGLTLSWGLYKHCAVEYGVRGVLHEDFAGWWLCCLRSSFSFSKPESP